MKLKKALEIMYKTPNRVASVVTLVVHGSIAITQAGMGKDYLLAKYEQFLEKPVLTTAEVLVPYVVTYLVNSGGRYLANRINSRPDKKD